MCQQNVLEHQEIRKEKISPSLRGDLKFDLFNIGGNVSADLSGRKLIREWIGMRQ